MTMEHFDVLIVGAGLSGIGAGHHLQTHCPDRRYAILEARAALGGTWDLFRYPGVRSDSDMFTLGYAFRPWQEAKAIAGGSAILAYLRNTAREHGIDRHIRYGHRLMNAAWSTPDARWTLEIERTSPAPGVPAETLRMSCNFLFMCSGYYRYDRGHTPAFPGIERFRGRIVHPQHWTDDIAVAGQRVVVIGSGATAVTLVPELAKTAAHVTMLQRSPTYMVALPSTDAIANALRRVLPGRIAYTLTRWKQVLLTMYFFNLCRRNPARAKALLLGGVRAQLGRDFDIATHFTPRYKPWEQRLCLVPDGDLFKSIKAGRASVATDAVVSFTETGLTLASGRTLEADLVVTATGLELQVLGGLRASVDGVPVDWAQTMTYKGLMFTGVPNLASTFGYANASWTLKSDLIGEYVCRLLNHLRASGLRQCTPMATDPTITAQPWFDFSSGYVQRALERLPKQGSRPPWRAHQNYVRDLFALRWARLDDGVMAFGNPVDAAATRAS